MGLDVHAKLIIGAKLKSVKIVENVKQWNENTGEPYVIQVEKQLMCFENDEPADFFEYKLEKNWLHKPLFKIHIKDSCQNFIHYADHADYNIYFYGYEIGSTNSHQSSDNQFFGVDPDDINIKIKAIKLMPELPQGVTPKAYVLQYTGY
jgi:hypothetical protein